MSRTLAALVAFGLVVGEAGRSDAGPITYTFTTDEDLFGPVLSGSFQVDSSDIGASGNTDISNFITGIEFKVDGLIFKAPDTVPKGVTVTSAGDLTTGAGNNQFVGTDTKFSFDLLLSTGGMTDQQYFVNSLGGSLAAEGKGHWTMVLGQPAPVPEPSTLILAGIGVLGLMGVVRRRRHRRDWVL